MLGQLNVFDLYLVTGAIVQSLFFPVEVHLLSLSLLPLSYCPDSEKIDLQCFVQDSLLLIIFYVYSSKT